MLWHWASFDIARFSQNLLLIVSILKIKHSLIPQMMMKQKAGYLTSLVSRRGMLWHWASFEIARFSQNLLLIVSILKIKHSLIPQMMMKQKAGYLTSLVLRQGMLWHWTSFEIARFSQNLLLIVSILKIKHSLIPEMMMKQQVGQLVNLLLPQWVQSPVF